MQYSIFKAPLFAFYSRDFYRQTARQGKGSGLLYLFVLVLVSNILSTASGSLHLISSLDNSPEFNEIVAKMPDISIKEGKLSINKESPYELKFKNPQSGKEVLIVFDTSGKKQNYEEAKAVLSQEGIVFEGQESVIPWSMPTSGKDFELPASKIKDSLKSISLLIFFLGLAFTPLFYLGHILLALLYGLTGLVMDRNKLGFKTSLRMASVAMTPSVVLTTLFYVFYCKPEIWELLTVPLTLGYLFFAFNSLLEAEARIE